MASRRRFPAPALVRNVDAGQLLENFLVSAVGALLAIRFYLALTGYPQIGGHGLHVAHMLWGGLLMLVALVMGFAFLGKRVQHAASIIGGLGFGTFIDELGKFITSDNNYFFHPTIAIIYVIFMVIFLAFRAIDRRHRLTQQGYLANALEVIREAVVHDMDEDDRRRALSLLNESDPREPLVSGLRTILDQSPVRATNRAGFSRRVSRLARDWYVRMVRWSWFPRLIVAVFTIHAVATVVGLGLLIAADKGFSLQNPGISFAEAGSTLSSAVSDFLVLVGVIRLRSSRLAAFHWFKRAILVSIFLAQFFSFYRQEVVAVLWLLGDLFLLASLDYLIHAEHSVQEHGAEVSAAPMSAHSVTVS